LSSLSRKLDRRCLLPQAPAVTWPASRVASSRRRHCSLVKERLQRESRLPPQSDQPQHPPDSSGTRTQHSTDLRRRVKPESSFLNFFSRKANNDRYFSVAIVLCLNKYIGVKPRRQGGSNEFNVSCERKGVWRSGKTKEELRRAHSGFRPSPGLFCDVTPMCSIGCARRAYSAALSGIRRRPCFREYPEAPGYCRKQSASRTPPCHDTWRGRRPRVQRRGDGIEY